MHAYRQHTHTHTFSTPYAVVQKDKKAVESWKTEQAANVARELDGLRAHGGAWQVSVQDGGIGRS